MKKYVFFTMLFLLFLKISNASAGVAANGMEVDRESLGVGGSGKFPTEVLGESRGVIGVFGPGWGMETPRDFSISTDGSFRMNEYSREIGVFGR